jgi:hypothetical protein
MDRRSFLFLPGIVLVASAQARLTIDATNQPAPPPRGRGPFPGSANPGHSAGLPIRLELRIPTGELRPDGTTLVDFIMTNVGTEPIRLPVAVDQNMERTDLLALWFTSDAIKEYGIDKTGRPMKVEVVGTSADLYGRSNHPETFHVLPPNETIRVYASSRVALNPGTSSLTAHAELARVGSGTEVVGTSDAKPIIKTLLRPSAP